MKFKFFLALSSQFRTLNYWEIWLQENLLKAISWVLLARPGHQRLWAADWIWSAPPPCRWPMILMQLKWWLNWPAFRRTVCFKAFLTKAYHVLSVIVKDISPQILHQCSSITRWKIPLHWNFFKIACTSSNHRALPLRRECFSWLVCRRSWRRNLKLQLGVHQAGLPWWASYQKCHVIHILGFFCINILTYDALLIPCSYCGNVQHFTTQILAPDSWGSQA